MANHKLFLYNKLLREKHCILYGILYLFYRLLVSANHIKFMEIVEIGNKKSVHPDFPNAFRVCKNILQIFHKTQTIANNTSFVLWKIKKQVHINIWVSRECGDWNLKQTLSDLFQTFDKCGKKFRNNLEDFLYSSMKFQKSI